MSPVFSRKSLPPSLAQKANEDLASFISDFANMMERHLETAIRSLENADKSLAAGVEAIGTISRANIVRADQFDMKSPTTKSFQRARARDVDAFFADPAALARPVHEGISVHLSGLNILEASVDRFTASFPVVCSVDKIALQRLENASAGVKAMKHAMEEILVHYRVHGALSHDFVDGVMGRLRVALVKLEPKLNVSYEQKSRA